MLTQSNRNSEDYRKSISSLSQASASSRMQREGSVMSAIIKVKHEKDKEQYCYCILEKSEAIGATLSAFKSKKQLTEKQRAKTKIWFKHIIHTSVKISSENTLSKFLFHLDDGLSSSTFYFKTEYNRNSWVQMLRDCGEISNTENIDTWNSYRNYVHSRPMSYSGTSLRGSRDFSRTDARSSWKSESALRNSSAAKLEVRTPLGKGQESVEVLNVDTMKYHNETSHKQTASFSCPSSEIKKSSNNENAEECRVSNLQSISNLNSRQAFLSKLMSQKEKELNKKTEGILSASIILNDEVHEPDTKELRDTEKYIDLEKRKPVSKGRSSRRQQILKKMMSKKEINSVSSHADSFYEDDDIDYVPRSTRKILRQQYASGDLRTSLHSDSDNMVSVPQTPSSGIVRGHVYATPMSTMENYQHLQPPSRIPFTPAQSTFRPSSLNFTPYLDMGKYDYCFVLFFFCELYMCLRVTLVLDDSGVSPATNYEPEHSLSYCYNQ